MDRIVACRQKQKQEAEKLQRILDRINRMDRIVACPPEAGQAICHRLRQLCYFRLFTIRFIPSFISVAFQS